MPKLKCGKESGKVLKQFLQEHVSNWNIAGSNKRQKRVETWKISHKLK